MNALMVSSDLKNYMNEHMHLSGQVHSVFNSAVNLITEHDDLITLLCEKKSIAPMSMIVKCDNFENSFIKKGSEVILMRTKIHFPEEHEQISLKSAEEWSALTELKFKPATPNVFKKHVSILESVLDREVNMDGIASVVYHLKYPDGTMGLYSGKTHKMNQYASFIQERIQQYMDDFRVHDNMHCQEDLRKIIGFGPGLTPSTDDFFVGFAASLIYMTRLFGLKKTWVKQLNRSLYESSRGRTTRVSEELIKHVSEGKMSKTLQDVFRALFSKEDERLHEKLSELISYGDTSGSDLLAGVYVAIRLLDSEEVRRRYS